MISKLTLVNLTSINRKRMEKAFSEIYAEYSYLVFYVSLKILRSNDLAKDVTEDTFIKFYQSRYEIKNLSSIKTFLSVTAKNLSLNKLKEEERFVNYDDDVEGKEEKRDDFQEYLTKFSSFLDESEIDLLVYHLLYDYSFKEIASLLGVSINSVTSKYKRTIDKVKKHYKGGK